MSTVGAVAQTIALTLEILKDHIDDPRRRARAIADYINGLRKLRDGLADEKDMQEIDNILLAIITAKP